MGAKAIDVVTGTDQSSGLVPPTPTKVSGAKSKWAGGDIRARKGSGSARVIQQGNGWIVEKDSPYGTPYESPYLGTPNSALSPYLPTSPGTPSFGPPPSTTRTSFGRVSPVPPSPRINSPSINALPPYSPRIPHTPSLLPRSVSLNQNDTAPGTPSHGHFPPTPGPSDSFSDAKKSD